MKKDYLLKRLSEFLDKKQTGTFVIEIKPNGDLTLDVNLKELIKNSRDRT
ncbi:Uncharacterised protein [Sebaldella termitidis]|uniref:Uncharacterized protein n=1 Tax=Sebaldella termitidis (strain ATCC 33386 / NCTC 11300) TaxID=526218 RepID=D1AGM0_SEBTE|nr:hypothetical protein [Sebaldella termitidis]ACZ10740.1 hypothetical protein Sterm_3907 [Sebaldella termitidis ATCC 33386]SUI26083.1 Uncharacterised protein [Sebaldella termitidis]